MIAIGFCGGKHCRPDHADFLHQHGAAYSIRDMRDLPILASGDLRARAARA
jgi:hypothetical protein